MFVLAENLLRQLGAPITSKSRSESMQSNQPLRVDASALQSTSKDSHHPPTTMLPSGNPPISASSSPPFNINNTTSGSHSSATKVDPRVIYETQVIP